MKHVSFLTIILLLLTFSGCSAWNPSLPEIKLVNLVFEDVQLLETTLIATVRIENGADTELKIFGASYDLSLNGNRIGKALSDESLVIPRFGSALQKLTLRVSNLQLGRRIQSLINSDNFQYEIDGYLTTDRTLWGRRVYVSESGGFSMTGSEL